MSLKPETALVFDRGTIVVRSSALLNTANLPGLVWDDRIGGWRASAHRFHEMQTKILGLIEDQPLAVGEQACRWKNIPLRPYQQAALAAWMSNGYRGLVVLPTGSGKTRIALAAAALRGVKTLFLVPTRVLLEQWMVQILEFYDGPVGVYGDGERSLCDVTIATYASAWRHMELIGNQFELLIVDEAHHFGDVAQDEILAMTTASARLGLTATPVQDPRAHQCMIDLIGPVVHSQSIADLAGKYLAEFENYLWLLPLSHEERRLYERDMSGFRQFRRAVEMRMVNPSWPDIVRESRKSSEWQAAMAGFRRARALVALTQGKIQAVAELVMRHRQSRVLIFTADTASAYRLSRLLLVPALTADIKRSEREKVLAAFRDGSIPALISCRVLNEGVDIPDADVAMILGGMAGGREHVQRVGRVLRPSAGKVAMVYELVAESTFEVRQAARRRGALGHAACG